jgi:predicted nuclease with RNAse H fold
MLFTEAVYVGIDPTAGVRPMYYAALDANLRLLALDRGDLETVLAFINGLEAAVVGVGAPQSPNKSLMMNEEVRRMFNLQPGGKKWGKWRVCEFELRRRNLRMYNTPSSEKAAPGWVKTGFTLFKRLQSMGFRLYFTEEGTEQHTLIEVQPHASFAVLLERRPFLKRNLEGRMQRQLVLYLEGLDIPNPMHALEEITRHHLLTGQMPLGGLYEHDQLDALVTAYTAYLVGVKPERVGQVGDEEEGLITIPATKLKDFYL